MASSSNTTGQGGEGEELPMKPRRLKGHTAAATCCIASLTRPANVASSGEDGRVCWFDLRCKRVAFTIDVRQNKNPVSSICFRPGNEDVIYASSGTEVLSFDIREASSWKQLETYKYNNDEINQISFSSKSSFLAAADDSGDVKIIDTQQQCLYKTLRAVHTSICSSVQFIRWKPWSVISGGLDSKLVMWNFSKECSYNVLDYGLPNLDHHGTCNNPGQSFNPPFVHSIAIPEEKLPFRLEKVCAVARGDGVVDIMDIESNLVTTKLKNLMKTRKGFRSISNGARTPEVNNDFSSQSLRKRLQLDYTFGGHNAAVSCVAFSVFGERGKFVISGGNDAFVKMWEWPKILDTRENFQRCACSSINVGRKVNCLTTAPKDSENLIVCDTSKIVKVYSLL